MGRSQEPEAWGCDPRLTEVTCRVVGTATPTLRTGTQERSEGRDTRLTEAEGGLLHTGGEEGVAGQGMQGLEKLRQARKPILPWSPGSQFCPGALLGNQPHLSSMKLIWTYNLQDCRE